MKNFRGQKSSFHEFNHMYMQFSVALTSVVARPNDILWVDRRALTPILMHTSCQATLALGWCSNFIIWRHKKVSFRLEAGLGCQNLEDQWWPSFRVILKMKIFVLEEVMSSALGSHMPLRIWGFFSYHDKSFHLLSLPLSQFDYVKCSSCEEVFIQIKS